MPVEAEFVHCYPSWLPGSHSDESCVCVCSGNASCSRIPNLSTIACNTGFYSMYWSRILRVRTHGDGNLSQPNFRVPSNHELMHQIMFQGRCLPRPCLRKGFVAGHSRLMKLSGSESLGSCETRAACRSHVPTSPFPLLLLRTPPCPRHSQPPLNIPDRFDPVLFRRHNLLVNNLPLRHACHLLLLLHHPFSKV